MNSYRVYNWCTFISHARNLVLTPIYFSNHEIGLCEWINVISKFLGPNLRWKFLNLIWLTVSFARPFLLLCTSLETIHITISFANILKRNSSSAVYKYYICLIILQNYFTFGNEMKNLVENLNLLQKLMHFTLSHKCQYLTQW